MLRQPTAGPSRVKQPPISAQSPPPPPSASGFNPSRTHFALASPVLGSADKVTIWDISSDRIVSEWEVEGAGKVSTLCWSTIEAGPSRKKDKRRKKSRADGEEEEVLLVATEAGDLIIYSPSRSQVVRKTQLGSKATAIWSDETATVIATSSSILVFSSDGTISHTFTLPPNTPAPTAITILSTSQIETLHILVASMNIITFHLHLTSSRITHSSTPFPVSTSSVTALLPVSTPTSTEGVSFLVVSEDDRTITQCTIPSPTKSPKLSYRYASPTLAPAHSISVSPSLLSVLHYSGEISLFDLPTELDLARPKSDSKPKSVRVVEAKTEQLSRLCRVAFANDAEGVASALICGRMAGAGRVKWYRAVYELPEGGVRSSTVVKCEAQDLVAKTANETSNLQRFAAPFETAEIPQDEVDESAATLPNDVDLADLSLGERLLSLPNGDAQSNGDATAKAKAAPALDGPVNAASLTRLLVQALHTSDPALLNLCLTHRDPVLIRNTIRKMPAQMALPLLKACVERLGQGKRSNKRGGGKGGGQNEQQARGTVEWVKGVLVERGAILMTMPSLPLHLANLSQMLQTRLQLYQPLLSLSGRLDLALAQIQMRQIAAANANAEGGGRKGGEGERYVEGESEDEEEDEDVVIETGDGDGEIEDVDMRGGDSEDEDEGDSEDEASEDDDEDDDDEDEDDDPLESGSEDGFLDIEAEEASGSEQSASEED